MNSRRKNYHWEALGENVYVFSPEDDVREIQAILDELWERQEANEFGKERYSIYFLPGKYDPALWIRVGFYMQICGLGYLPDDVEVPKLTCNAEWNTKSYQHNATCNFWRGVENLKIGSNTMWAVSQATFMRRVHVAGALELHDNYGWASGGFLADSVVDLLTDAGTQQQWLSRNCDWKAWIGDNWNIVFAGIETGKAPRGTWPLKKFTVVEQVEEIQEKPFLVLDQEKGLGVFVPARRKQAVGVSWNPSQQPAGSFLPLSEFYVANPRKDTAQSLNQALEHGKNLFFTPGIYPLEQELVVEHKGTILLGTGLATLQSADGNACIRVKAEEDVILAGILFEAGFTDTPLLVQIGEKTGKAVARSGHGTMLSDLFFRVGGALKEAPAMARCCLEINSSHVIGDNFWIWRADHGHQVGWHRNKANHGLIVNGDQVTLYALMVEHFMEYQTIWRGNGGKVIMYQSEIPYDVPAQREFVSHKGKVNGYASYRVEEETESHEAWGIGIYSYNRDAEIEIHSALEAPQKPGIKLHHVCAIMITGHPGITHVINEEGGPCKEPGRVAMILEYEKNNIIEKGEDYDRL